MWSRYFLGLFVALFLTFLSSPSTTWALPGDLDASGIVDGTDLVSFGLANGSTDGDPNWNPDADLDDSGTVDLPDLTILSTHFAHSGLSFCIWLGDALDGDNRVAKISEKGQILLRQGSYQRPDSIAANIQDGSIWIADSDAAQQFVRKVSGTSGETLLTVNGVQASSIAVNSVDGSLWISDSANDRIFQLLPTITDGYDLSSDTGQHIVVTGFDNPLGITVNGDGTVWIADNYHNQVVRLSAGIFDGYDISTDSSHHRLITGLNRPGAIAVDQVDGTVWIADTGTDQIFKYDENGTTRLMARGGFANLQALAVNFVDHSVWIADTGLNEVIRLDSSGALIHTTSGFSSPRNLDVDPLTGACWVLDTLNSQLVKLAPDGTELLRINGVVSPLSLAVSPNFLDTSKYPTAEGSVDQNAVDSGVSVTFSTVGTDPDGLISLYEWDFDGDGTFDYSSLTDDDTTHTYQSTGIYNAVLRVTDNDYLQATDYSIVIRVGRLEAAATADPISGSAPLRVDFSGSSFDPIDGVVDSYQWDFDGNGSFDYYSETTPDTNYTYSKAGTYTVSLKVTDGAFIALADDLTITVAQTPPTVIASISPGSGEAPLEVTCTGSGSDLDGTVVLYQWDMDGDGTYDWSSTTSGDRTYTYTGVGQFNATLQVTDNDGNTTRTSVLVAPGEIHPLAEAGADVTVGYGPLSVNLNADGSVDPDGTITTYEWNFAGECSETTIFSDDMESGEGLWQADSPWAQITTDAHSGTTSWTDSPAGDYQNSADTSLTLEINGDSADSGDLVFWHHYHIPESYDHGFVEISADGGTSWTQLANFYYTQDTWTEETFSLDQYLPSADLRLRFRLDTDGSVTGDGWYIDDVSINQCELDWTVSVDGTADHVYSAPGTYTATLRITDNDGNISLEQVVITVLPDSVPLATAAADVSSGYSPLSVNFTGSAQYPDGTVSEYQWNFGEEFVWVIDTTTDELIRLAQDGSRQLVKHSFVDPVSLTIDPSDGTIWVADKSRDEIVHLAADGVMRLGSVGGFNDPISLVINPADSTIWVVDYYHHQVVHLNAQGLELSRTSGFSYPSFIAVNDIDGSAWVVDGSQQVVKLSAAGEELARIGGFSGPRALAVNPATDHVWVVDYTGDQVVRLDSTIAGGYDFTVDTGQHLIAPVSVNNPASVAVNQTDNSVWIADYYNNQAVKIGDDGVELLRSAPISYPLFVAVNSADGTCWVASSSQHAVVKFDADGTELARLDTFSYPLMTAVATRPGNTYSNASSGNIGHTYTLPGVYYSLMTAFTNDGQTDSVGILIEVAAVPTVSLSVDNSGGPAPHEAFFSVEAEDKDGNIVKYEWDFDSDGTVDKIVTDRSLTVSHLYESAGVYSASLTVTDNDDNSAQDSVQVTVTTQPPRVSASAAPSSGNAPLAVVFSGVASDDDGSVELYEWDFENDGTFDTSSASNADASYSYSVAGEYNAVLRVTDNDTLQTSDTVVVSVLPVGTPRALLKADPMVGMTPLAVNFCVHGQDSGGSISNYEMDFEGDGTYDVSFATPPTALYDEMENGSSYWTADAPWAISSESAFSGSFAFSDSPGSDYANDIDISLTSMTLDLSTADAPWLTFRHRYNFLYGDYGRVEISVNGGGYWAQLLNYSNATVDEWTAVQYDLYAYRGNATVMIRFRLASNSADTGEGWFIDDVLVGDCTVQHSYATAGTYNATLRVTDNESNQDSSTVPITVYAVDNSSFVWGMDTSHDQVVKMSEEGEILARISGFDNPRAAAVDPVTGDVWVADTTHDQVVKLNAAIQNGYSIAATNIADSVFGGPAGAISGDVALTAGTINSAMHFDGSGDYITIPNDESHRTNSWTMEAWVKPASFDSINTIFGKVSQSKDFGLVLNNDYLGVLVYHSGRKYLLNPTAATVDQWYHVAATFTSASNTLNLYVDGTLVNTTTDWTPNMSNTDNLMIGRSNCCSTECFNGDIDDVRFWNIVKSQAEIAANMNTALTGNESGLISYFSLDAFSDHHQLVTGFNDPYYVAVDATDSSVWITDYYNHQIVKLDSSGTELHRIDGFSYPRRLAMCQADQSVWITDNSHDQVVHLDKNGVELSRIAGFNDSIGVSVDQSDCSVWIADYSNDQVVKLDSAGNETVRQGGFDNPVGISVNSNDHNVWVTDYLNQQVVKLNSDGAELLRVDNFNRAHDIKVNQKDGTVWIADYSDYSFIKLAPDGSRLYRVAGLYYPTSLAIDEGIRLLSDPPVASGSVTPESGEAPLLVTFDSSASTDDSAIIRYEWDFDGDTFFDYSSSTPGITTHSYDIPGTYNPVLRVTDDQGLIDYDISNSLLITPLTVTLQASPVTGPAPLSVDFHAVVTGLLAGQTVSYYEWDYDGDGIIDATVSNSTQSSYEYPRPGDFTAIVKITANDGNTAFGSVPIIVEYGPPTVTGYVSVSSGPLPLLVALTGSASDPDGSIVLFEWDYDGDGTYDWFSANSASTYFTYRQAATYTPTLRVTDNDGVTATYSRTVTVSDSVLPPVVAASADPVKAYVNTEEVTFSGICHDPDDNTITLYEWDFEGDGIFDYSSPDVVTTTHTYTQPGQYAAVLRVTDGDTLTTSDHIGVTVLVAGAPSAVIQTTSPISGMAPLSVEFDGSSSTDPDGTIVEYQWGFGTQEIWVGDMTNDRLKSIVGGNITASYAGFDNPHYLAVDEVTGVTWVSNYSGNDVVKIAVDGTELSRSTGFNRPHGIGVDKSDHSVWVADYENHQVVHLDENGVELARLDGFNGPVDIAVDQVDHSVWITDYRSHQVVRLDAAGVETGRFPGFYYPYMITYNPADRSFLLSDSGHNQIVRLSHDTPDGYVIETTRVTADIAAGTEALLINDDAVTAVGQLNGAVRLNDPSASSPSYFLLPAGPVLDVQSFTFETWYQSSDVYNKTLFMRGDNSGYNEVLIYFPTATRLDVVLNHSSTYQFNGAVTFSDGIWRHIAVVHDAALATLTCYVDGVQYGDVHTPSVVLDFGSSNALIGADFDSFNGGLGNYFVGDLDDVRLWNIPRTALEIAGSYGAELSGTEPGLIGYWPMNSVTDTPFHTLRDGFASPRCVEVDPYDQSVWVCDYDNSQMVKLSPALDREILRVDGFNRPFGAVINPYDSSVWVADRNNHQVVQLSNDGVELQRISGFYNPQAIGLHIPSNSSVTNQDASLVTHTFTSDGSYLASLQVTDNDGLTDRDSMAINVGGPESLPIAYPITGKAPLEVRFSANGSCATCTLVLFSYDYNGDGTIDWQTTISENNSYTYHTPGTYTVSQTVTGNTGLTDTETVTVTVLAQDEQLVAEALAVPEEGVSPLTVQLTGLGSSVDSFISNYEWDFENDGTFDFSSASNGMVSHDYTAVGTYTALFRVTDEDANSASSTVTIRVKEVGAPTAYAAATPVDGITPLNVTLSGTADDDGFIALYEWDFDGDATYDWSSTETGIMNHEYASPGTFEATLRVTDNSGRQDTAVVMVRPSMNLTASLSHDIIDPTNQETVSINSVLTSDADVSVKVIDRNGGLVRTLIDNEARSAGFYSDSWDGKDNGANIVASGIYLYIIEYTIGGITHVYDVTNNANPARQTPPVTYPISFNPLSSDTNFFRYTLAHKGEITIYISYFSGTAGERVKTLLLRYPQPAGSYVQVWDGTDDQGELVNATTYVIAVFSWDLPENGVIVRKEPVISDLSVIPTYLNPAALPYDEMNSAEFSFTLSKLANVQVTIRDEANYIIRTLSINDVPAGIGNTFVWDGKNNDGKYVSPGTYRVKVVATDGNGAVSLDANALVVIFY